MKILVLGHGRHGKDTVAELLRLYHGLTFTSSSFACAEVLKPVLDLVNGEQSAAQHFEHRHAHRELWKRLISLFTAADASALARHILRTSDVYVGMRSMREYAATVTLFDHVFWVDAGSRVIYKDPTMEIAFDPETMHLVNNSGTLRDLELRMARLFLGGRKTAHHPV